MKECHAIYEGDPDKEAKTLNLQRGGRYKVAIQPRNETAGDYSRVFVWINGMYHPIMYKKEKWKKAWVIVD